MRSLSLSRAWDETKAILVREGSLLAAVALALIALPQILLAVVGAPVGARATMLGEVTYIAAVLLGFVGQVAINRLAIGPAVTVRDAIARGLIRLWSVFAALLVLATVLVLVAIVLAAILSAIGVMALPAANQPPAPSLLALLIVLIVLTFAIFQLVFPLAAVETGNPIRLVTRSWQLGRHQYARLLAFLFVVFGGIVILGLAGQFGVGSVVVLLLGQPNPGTFAALVLGLVIGIIQAAFTATTAVMLARIYVQLAGREDEVAEAFR